MREVLFRGKRIDGNEWVVGSLYNEGDQDAVIIESLSCYSDGFMQAFGAAVDPATVGQFTGLLDKNGKRIYEGDIVRCAELINDKITEYTSPVFWDDCTFLVRESENCDCCLCVFDGNPDRRPLTEIEVIGNIHDNPELLGGAE